MRAGPLRVQIAVAVDAIPARSLQAMFATLRMKYAEEMNAFYEGVLTSLWISLLTGQFAQLRELQVLVK